MRLDGKNGPLYLSTDLLAGLKAKFPRVDVESEVAKMHLWLTRYPNRRPANVWRFVDNWLKKAPATVAPVLQAWWTTPERVVQQGAALGLTARPGEEMGQFKERISRAIGGRGGGGS